jgi:hypothetical protein
MGWTPGTKGRIEGDVVILSARSPEELQKQKEKYKGKLKNAIVLQGAPRTVQSITEMASRRAGGQDGPPRRGGEGRGGDAVAKPGGEPPAKPGDPPAKPGEPPAKPGAADKPGQPPAKPGEGGRPGGFDTRPGREGFMAMRREMAEFLRSEGVACMLQDAGKPHGLFTMTGNWGSGMGREDRTTAQEPLPTLFVGHDHYALLYRLASRPEPARTRLELDVHNVFIPGPIPVYNTVGEIRGTEKPDEFVVLGAHLDSWDLAQGTTDNGTGSCIVLETARVLAKCGVKPKRTIRFVLFTGEEQGLHGSRAYVNQHKDEMPKTSAAIVHDTGTGKVVTLALQGREKLKPILEKEIVSLKELGVKELSTRNQGGSDHQSFDRAGVPGFMFQQEWAEYTLTHHSQSDTLDKAREPDLIQGSQVMAVLAMRIANLDSLLPRERR